MENNNQQSPVDQQLPQPVQQPSILPSTSPKPKLPLFILIALAALIIIGGGIYLSKISRLQSPERSNGGQTNLKPTQTAILSPIPTIDETANWKTYTLNNIGIAFQLPPKIFNLGNYGETISEGLKGKIICFKILEKTSLRIIPKIYAGGWGACIDPKSNFLIGSTSIDFEEGRGGTFTDMQGLVEKNGKYYAKFVDGNQFELPQEVVTKVNNNFGISIIKVTSKKFEEGEAERHPVPGTPNDGTIGALINTKNEKHPGLAVQMVLNQDLNEQLFDQILQTFKFTQ